MISPILSAPWIEQYFTNGLKSYRMYARAWKFGEDPDYETLWKVCLQEIERGIVLAERVTEYEWVPKDVTLQWAEDRLPGGFRPVTKQEASFGKRGPNGSPRFPYKVI